MIGGFFTQGVDFELPHPKIPERTIILITKVVDHAWKLLEAYPPENFDFKKADEDTITEKLVWIIENRLRQKEEINGFNTRVFGKVTRDSKVTNFDNKHPDKMPDMFFDLKRDDSAIISSEDGIFVECKPIDKKHTLYSCYCKKGLNRFVIGDYAWTMREALIIGYARNQYTFPDLDSTLNDKKSKFLNIIQTFHDSTNKLYVTEHDRHFCWKIANSKKACPIKIYHCWQYHSE